MKAEANNITAEVTTHRLPWLRLEHWRIWVRPRLEFHLAGIKIGRVKFMVGWHLLLGGVVCQAMIFGFELAGARAQGREQAHVILKMQWELAEKLEKDTSEGQYGIVVGGRHNVAKCSTGVYGDLFLADPDWNSVSGSWSIVSGKRNTVFADRVVLIGGSGHTADTDDQVLIADENGAMMDEVNPRLSRAIRQAVFDFSGKIPKDFE